MIQLDLSSRTPVYLQIKERITELIMMEVCPPDSRLPSVRSLAMELGINPNTIQKAYQELEAEGVIYTVGGKGCFAGSREKAVGLTRQRVLGELRDSLHQAQLAGIAEQELAALVEEIYGGDSK